MKAVLFRTSQQFWLDGQLARHTWTASHTKVSSYRQLPPDTVHVHNTVFSASVSLNLESSKNINNLTFCTFRTDNACRLCMSDYIFLSSIQRCWTYRSASPKPPYRMDTLSVFFSEMLALTRKTTSAATLSVFNSEKYSEVGFFTWLNLRRFFCKIENNVFACIMYRFSP